MRHSFVGYKMATSGTQDCDDVPPLEDMTEMLRSISDIKQTRATMSEQLPKSEFLEPAENPEEAKMKRVRKLLGKEDREEEKQQTVNSFPSHQAALVTKQKQQEMKKQGQGFAGFQKGFLNPRSKQPVSKENKKAAKASKKELDVVKIQKPSKLNDSLVFNEVQEALAAQMPLLKSKEWITEDLLSKVEKNPKLLKQLEDPRFSQALTAFQSNPQQAMLAVQNDPEVKEFIQEFCGLLGEHFTHLGEEDATKKNASKHIETLEVSSTRNLASGTKVEATQDEHERFKKIISDPEIKEILADHQIQRLFNALKENPAMAQRALAELGPRYHSKIQRLIEAGLLGVARK